MVGQGVGSLWHVRGIQEPVDRQEVEDAMVKPRVIETNVGIQDEEITQLFDVFARDMRDKGWNGAKTMIAAGIQPGDVLEVGPGPGYVGLEVAKRLKVRSLTGCEISPAMKALAEKNAAEYRIEANYVLGNAMEMPFPDESFDSVISNGSMHEWEDPVRVLREIYRVLRPGGCYCITDLRRDLAACKVWFVYQTTKPKKIRPGFLTSLHAAYTVQELEKLAAQAGLPAPKFQKDFFGLSLSGRK